MKGYTWYVFQIEDDGGFYAYAERIHHSNNLKHYAERAYTMNACATKREAEEIAADWNECARRNGRAPKWMMPKGA